MASKRSTEHESSGNEELGVKHMTKAELTKYRKFLEDKLAELSEVVRNREGITIEKNADALD